MVGADKFTATHVLLLFLCCFRAAIVPAANAAAETIHTSLDCSAAVLGVSDCLTFVQIGSKEAKPQGQCCSGLQKVKPEETSCLCQESIAYGMKINMTKARTLAPACGLKTPPNLSVVPAVFSPAAVPVPVPSAYPATGPSVASVPPPPPPQVPSVAASLPAPSLVSLLIAAAAFAANHL